MFVSVCECGVSYVWHLLLSLCEVLWLLVYFKLCLTSGWNDINGKETTAGKSVSWSILPLLNVCMCVMSFLWAVPFVWGNPRSSVCVYVYVSPCMHMAPSIHNCVYMNQSWWGVFLLQGCVCFCLISKLVAEVAVQDNKKDHFLDSAGSRNAVVITLMPTLLCAIYQKTFIDIVEVPTL